MLDFRQNSSQRTTESWQARRRLLVLILMLGIVLILMDRARDPAIRRGLSRLLFPPQGPGGGISIDNRSTLAAQGKPLPDGLSVPPGDFEAVCDDAPSTRDEQACSLRLLDILNHTDSEALSQASLGPVSYAQLFRQPNQYRGRLVTVSGVVHRANRVELPPNDYGIKEYYQVWLWPSDNPSAPIVVYCLRLPRGFPTGMELAEQAAVTGYFFKRWAYQAHDVLRSAPELLARTLQWEQRPVMTPPQSVETWSIPLVVGVAALAALLATGIVYLRTRATRPDLTDRPPNFDVLYKMDQQEQPDDTHG